MPTITLTKGYVALVDDADADLACFNWRAIVDSDILIYGRRHLPPGSKLTYSALHREIAERAYGAIPNGLVVDHINGDTLDNRRANLRIVTDQRNRWNRHRPYRNSRSGVIGVCFRADQRKWRAYIDGGTKRRYLGGFGTIEEARAARLSAEQERELSLAA